MIKIVHMIFIQLSNKSLEDYGYDKNIEIWRLWCDKNDFKLMIHNEETINKISTEKDLEMLKLSRDEGRHPFFAIDWGKYKVLNHYGGIYCDMDCVPKDNAIDYFDSDMVIGTYYWRKWKYGSGLLYMKDKELWREFLDISYDFYFEKSKIKVYDTWICRFLLQVAGPNGIFSKWCKSKKIPIREDFNDYFIDYYTSAWKTWEKKK